MTRKKDRIYRKYGADVVQSMLKAIDYNRVSTADSRFVTVGLCIALVKLNLLDEELVKY
jgi:hypothetical protein